MPDGKVPEQFHPFVWMDIALDAVLVCNPNFWSMPFIDQTPG